MQDAGAGEAGGRGSPMKTPIALPEEMCGLTEAMKVSVADSQSGCRPRLARSKTVPARPTRIFIFQVSVMVVLLHSSTPPRSTLLQPCSWSGVPP